MFSHAGRSAAVLWTLPRVRPGRNHFGGRVCRLRCCLAGSEDSHLADGIQGFLCELLKGYFSVRRYLRRQRALANVSRETAARLRGSFPEASAGRVAHPDSGRVPCQGNAEKPLSSLQGEPRISRTPLSELVQDVGLARAFPGAGER
jgi:hypothetical protein